MAFDPAQVGQKLIAVGEGQKKTGTKLKESAQELRVVAASFEDNARLDTALGSIKDAARAIRDLLSPVATAFHSVSNVLDDIRVPSVEWDVNSYNIPGFGTLTVVTGISLSSTRPFRGVATSLETVADNLDSVRGGLRTIGNGARDIQNELPTLKTRLVNGADEMEEGGQNLAAAGTAMVEAGTLLAS